VKTKTPFSGEAESSEPNAVGDIGNRETKMNPIIDGPDQQSNSTSIPDYVKPWEEISAGRYMPRRIRGSCIGRELG
jgi:hypothetical protein